MIGRLKSACRVVRCRAIAETFEIKAYNNDSTAVVFDMTGYLLSDQKMLSPFSPYSLIEMMGVKH